MHQVWKVKLDCDSDILIVWNLSDERHTIRLLQTDSNFGHHCLDIEQSSSNCMNDIFTLDCEVKTRIVSDDLPVDLTLEEEPERVLDKLEVDFPQVGKLVSRVLKDVELCTEKTINCVFALLNTERCCDLSILNGTCYVRTLSQVCDVNTAHHFSQHRVLD